MFGRVHPIALLLPPLLLIGLILSAQIIRDKPGLLEIPSEWQSSPPPSIRGENSFFDSKDGRTGRQREMWERKAPISDTIHLALVLCGKKKASQARILAESVNLFSAGSTVHWHLVVDEEALSELRNTGFMKATARRNSVYPMESYFHIFEGTDDFLSKRYKFTWMWSKCKGLKVQLASVIRDIDRVILLDVDTIVVSPLERLWQHFDDEFSGLAPLLHMAVDTSGYYSRGAPDTKSFRVQLPNAGFNSGVILMHLDRMRDMSSHPAFLAEKLDEQQVAGQYSVDLTDWGKLAFQVTKTQPRGIFYLLGDQDMFNAAIDRYPGLAQMLPCGWNFQLVYNGFGWISKVCNVSSVEIRLIHGNGNRFMKDPQYVPLPVRGYTALYAGLRKLVLPDLELTQTSPEEEEEKTEDSGKGESGADQ